MKKIYADLWRVMRPLAFFAGIKGVSLCKMSYMVGSRLAFFSAANILYPLGGLYLGVSGISLWFIASLLIRLLLGGSFWLYLIHGIPGLCAALYTAHSNPIVRFSIRFFLPLMCMVLFIAHPVGFQAMPYAFYWLIPIVFYVLKKQSLFADALGATFVAHAVGSVFWLYLIPMPVSYWWGLMPIVMVERLSFATGSVLVYSGCMYCQRLVKSLKNSSFFIGRACKMR